ncbi:hypothetical protein Q5752_005849 [Cryptotrichosporon argae]
MPIKTSGATWLRLIRFEDEHGEVHLGEPVDNELDIGLAVAEGTPVLAHVLDAETPWDADARRTGETKLVVRLLCPLTPQQTGAIRATGLSYIDHAKEMKLALPIVPSLFFKPAATLADPNSAVPVPPVAQDDEVDYEVELAIVIGRRCKNVTKEDALKHVLGWTVVNDLTARKQQDTSSQWGYAKGFDSFCPLGPCIVSTRLLPDPKEVVLQTFVNGDIRQDGTARKMIWHVSEIISYLSQGSTLLPGTVISTGTPPGIGWSRVPRAWLKDGDEVRCHISHGLGTLVNTITYERARPPGDQVSFLVSPSVHHTFAADRGTCS